MRLLIAGVAGLGVFALTAAMLGIRVFTRRQHPRRTSRVGDWLIQVGSPLSVSQFVAASVGLGAFVWFVGSAMLGDPVAAFFPSIATSGLIAWTYNRRRQQRLTEIRNAWPDAIRQILAYVRSGATIPMAVSSLAESGPAPLRTALDGWDQRNRLLGFDAALASVRTNLADPTSDRVIEVLLIAHEWGGELVATVLEDLANEVTEDLRTERAIAAEGTTQRIEGWVVGVVPWLLLAYLMATQPEYRTFYETPQGRFVVIAAGLWWSVGLAILATLRRADTEPRVLISDGARS